MKAAKIDANHTVIVEALQKAGWTVRSTARLGFGFPDAIAARRGRLELIEIKGPKGKLTDDQVRFHRDMATCGITVKVLRDVTDAVRL